MVDCTKCLNSACCRLSIQISKKEYDSLKPIVKDQFYNRVDDFLMKSPHLQGIKSDIEKMYTDNYAEMKKSNDGYCPLLDRQTKLCTVYKDRPKTCQDYTTNKCEKIRLMNHDN